MDKIKQTIGIALITTGALIVARRVIGTRGDLASGALLAFLGIAFMSLAFSGQSTIASMITGKPNEVISFVGPVATWRGVVFNRDPSPTPGLFPFRSLVQALRAARVKRVTADVRAADDDTLNTFSDALAAEGISLTVANT